MSVAFIIAVVAGRMPGMGYAHDHQIALLATVIVATLCAILEMTVVWHLFDKISPLQRLRNWILKPRTDSDISTSTYSDMLTPALWPAGGMWISLGLATTLGLGMRYAIPIIGAANGIAFGLYFSALGAVAWYIAAAQLIWILSRRGYRYAQRYDWSRLHPRRLLTRPA